MTIKSGSSQFDLRSEGHCIVSWGSLTIHFIITAMFIVNLKVEYSSVNLERSMSSSGLKKAD